MSQCFLQATFAEYTVIGTESITKRNIEVIDDEANMRFWIEFFKDKRFNFRFKIANLVMGDRLREYLAVNCAALQAISKTERFTEFHKKKINRAVCDLRSLMGREG